VKSGERRSRRIRILLENRDVGSGEQKSVSDAGAHPSAADHANRARE
jgi:hypothetical protein